MTLEWGKTEVLLALSRAEWETLFRLLVIATERLRPDDVSREECRRARILFTRLREEFAREMARLKASSQAG